MVSRKTKFSLYFSLLFCRSRSKFCARETAPAHPHRKPRTPISRPNWRSPPAPRRPGGMRRENSLISESLASPGRGCSRAIAAQGAVLLDCSDGQRSVKIEWYSTPTGTNSAPGNVESAEQVRVDHWGNAVASPTKRKEKRTRGSAQSSRSDIATEISDWPRCART